MRTHPRALIMLAAIAVAHTAPVEPADAPGARRAPPLDEPLVARPGMMIGRVMTWDGRPVPRFTIEYAAYALERAAWSSPAMRSRTRSPRSTAATVTTRSGCRRAATAWYRA